MIVAAGSTNVTTYFALRKTADGTAATALTITDIDLQYVRSGAAPAAKVDATALAATDSAHGDNQAIEIDATDAPGLYRVDWPDAAFAAGVREVILSVKVATAFTEHLRVELSPQVDLVTDAVDSTSMADNAITANKIATDAITAAKIAANAITSSEFADGTITAAKIATDAITATKIATDAITAAKIAADAIGASELATDAVNEIRDSILADSTAFNGASIAAILTDTGTTLDNHLTDIKGTGFAKDTHSLPQTLTATGFSTHNAADVWTSGTRTLTASTNFNDISVADILTTNMTEAYAADTAAMSLANALHQIWAVVAQTSISGTTRTAYKLDGTTTAMTFTLDDGTTPTDQRRTT